MNTGKGTGMSNRAKIREEAKKLNPIDDLMFRTMAEDKDFCEERMTPTTSAVSATMARSLRPTLPIPV